MNCVCVQLVPVCRRPSGADKYVWGSAFMSLSIEHIETNLFFKARGLGCSFRQTQGFTVTPILWISQIQFFVKLQNHTDCNLQRKTPWPCLLYEPFSFHLHSSLLPLSLRENRQLSLQKIKNKHGLLFMAMSFRMCTGMITWSYHRLINCGTALPHICFLMITSLRLCCSLSLSLKNTHTHTHSINLYQPYTVHRYAFTMATDSEGPWLFSDTYNGAGLVTTI